MLLVMQGSRASQRAHRIAIVVVVLWLLIVKNSHPLKIATAVLKELES